MSDRERRESERIDLLGTLHGDVLVVEATEIRQLGLGGMLIETRFPLHVDSLHDFRLVLGDHSLVLKGRVVHSRINDVAHDVVTYQSGIEFIDPSDAVATAIREFIGALKQSREKA